MPMTPEEMAAHKARLQIIEMLGWGPSSMASAEWIVHRINKLLLQIDELKRGKKTAEEAADHWLHVSKDVNAVLTKKIEELAQSDRLIEGVKKIVHEHVVNYRGSSIQVAFPEDARKALVEIHKILAGIEAEILASLTTTEKRICVHKWFHVEDHHVICEKCKHVADLCWTCGEEKTKTRDGGLVCLKCNPQ